MSMLVVANIGWAITFAIVGALIGIFLVVATARFVPGIIDKITPNIDEDKEILRGNSAVAEYFGRIVAATILGVSIVVAAAVLGGILAGLHG